MGISMGVLFFGHLSWFSLNDVQNIGMSVVNCSISVSAEHYMKFVDGFVNSKLIKYLIISTI